MTDKSIFEQANTATGQVAPAEENKEVPVNEFVGEGKKYKTEADALAALPHQQNHISKLEEENAALAAQVARIELKNALSGGEKPAENVPAVIQAPAAEDLTSSVTAVVEGLRKTELEQLNYQKVEKELTDRFGNESANQLKALSQRVNLDIASLEKIAKQSPEAFLAMLPNNVAAGANQQSALVPGNTSNSAVGAVGEGTRNFAYYEKIRKSDSSLYWKADTQKMLHQDAAKLGDSFFS